MKCYSSLPFGGLWAMVDIKLRRNWFVSFLDIIQCWGSVTSWCGSGSGSRSPDPYLWLMDPTTFFHDFKDKINIKKFHIFFLYLTHRYIIFSLKNLIFCKHFVLKLIPVKHFFSPLNTFMGKGKDPDPDPYL